ncbi:MAG: helix-turn-helix domain-containing protein [Pseudonocardiales bacterium]|nr:helix-turn-helix domain-containing protein [Pseudonocardiales bacterium]
MPKRDEDERTELGRSFLDARNDAGLSQEEVVARVKVPEIKSAGSDTPRTNLSQTQLSRIEWGASLPTVLEAEKLSQLYGLDAARQGQLVQRVKEARAGISDSRLVIQRGNTLGSTLVIQRRWRRLERDSEMVRAYQPAVVLGVLQTAAYAAAVLRQPESSDVVRDRQIRYQQLVNGPTPRQVLIQTEGALRFTVGSAAVMAEQVDALIVASRRPHVRLGVIPAARPVDRVTTNAFHLYDHAAVVLGVEVAAATLDDEEDLTHFQTLFADLERFAVFDDEARVLLRRIADDHRGESRPAGTSAP